MTIMRGGFIKENLRRAIIAECIESGDAESFFANLEDVMGEIRDEIDESGDEPLLWDTWNDQIALENQAFERSMFDFGDDEDDDDTEDD